MGVDGDLLDWDWQPGDYSGPYVKDGVKGVMAMPFHDNENGERELVVITSPPHVFVENDDGTLSIDPILAFGQWLL